ncbi:outer membrane protein transport protein [Ferrimonas lipolytica]|uniref:Transporter n=1 Tax=Ferrimonas lipolytica TaxID=2724191 RepID=A0A6H1UIF1_9GAMM|nr:outer membrane protein transport protein [Ferrimonas lipolytica]QIZ78093.1 transporter [Ferrimonas lipolytica]
MQFRKLSLLVAALVSGHVSAAGFQLSETSATGLGRAFAGAAAVADNASSQGRNAAMLLALDGIQFSAGAVYIDPEVDTDGTVTYFNPVTGQMQQANADLNDYVPSAVVPNFYFSHKVDNTWAYGIGVTSNYGLTSETPSDDHAAAFLGSKTEVITVELNPNVAYAIDENYSIGFGIRALYADGEIIAHAPSWTDGLNQQLVAVGAAPAYPPGGTLLSKVSGDDIAWGYNFGVHWQSNKGHSLGFAYHSAIDLELEGDYNVFAGEAGYVKRSASMDVTLPAFAEFAGAHQLTPALRMSASIKWTQWSEFDDLIVDYDGGSDLLKEEKFDDSWRFALGADYRINSNWLMRTGVAYDQAAVDNEHRTLSIPDSDRIWLSGGVAYEFSPQLTLDFSATYIAATGDGDITEEQPALGALYEGEVDGDVWLLGVQASYRF